jgi:hypothetical protein
MSEREQSKPVILPVRATGHSAVLKAAGGASLRPIQLNDEPEVLALIGRVAVLSAYVERLLDRMIWQLLRLGPIEGAVQTRSLPNLEQRFDRILALGAEQGLPDTLLMRLPELRRRAIALGEARARIIHDPWYVETDSGRSAQFRAMPKRAATPIFDFVHVAPEEVRNVLEDQVKLWNDLAPIHDEIADLMVV